MKKNDLLALHHSVVTGKYPMTGASQFNHILFSIHEYLCRYLYIMKCLNLIICCNKMNMAKN